MDFVPVARSGRLWKNKADFFRPFRSAAAATNLRDSNTNQLNEEDLYFEPKDGAAVYINTEEEPDLRDLNTALAALIDVFPNVQPEVFREMLQNIGPESRLQVVAERLLQKEAKWTRGRFRTPETVTASTKTSAVRSVRPLDSEKAFVDQDLPSTSLSREDSFRTSSYQKAVKQVLYQEFPNLSHSTIKGVLAEQNFSYAACRQVLQQGSARRWLSSLFSFWNKKSSADQISTSPPGVIAHLVDVVDGTSLPAVRRTGDEELDRELYDLFCASTIAKHKDDRLLADYAAAREINEAEAEDIGAMFDCECCYTSAPFEEVATCTDGCHVLCLDCIRRTVNEAMYGQGWARTVDLCRSTVRCFSPTAQDCSGCISQALVTRALRAGGTDDTLWQEFQTRISADVLMKSRLPLQRCPFCEYAEIDSLPPPRLKHPRAIWQHIMTKTSIAFQVTLVSTLVGLSFFAAPIMGLSILLLAITQLIPASMLPLQNSCMRVHNLRRNLRFSCRNPACARPSCLRCRAAWREAPAHTCFERAQASLRTTLEASATLAVKRTCPRCSLSFVKDSGCNKLTCPCGYVMCYVCRQEIRATEGYAHFCQHFRPHGGRCGECERCDLYGNEDEEKSIRMAVDAAEKAWREKESRGGGGDGEDDEPSSVADEEALRVIVEAVVGETRGLAWWEQGLDAVLDAFLA